MAARALVAIALRDGVKIFANDHGLAMAYMDMLASLAPTGEVPLVAMTPLSPVEIAIVPKTIWMEDVVGH